MKQVVTFYQFFDLADPEALQVSLQDQAGRAGLKGSVLLATEGVNGTLAGPRTGLDQVISFLRTQLGLKKLAVKYSTAHAHNDVFFRLRIKVKPEIVTFGKPGLKPGERTGVHVGVDEWHALLDDPDLILLDTRNHYEIAIGSFPGAIDPKTVTFREFADFVDQQLPQPKVTAQEGDDRQVASPKVASPKVAMYCTGGIRCEKASAYLLEQGFDEVYQLDGGILRYLEEVDDADSRWAGECFVFDQRVSVTSDLTQGEFAQCFACRHPLSETELASVEFEQGVSCPYCIESLTPQRRAGFEERERQIRLSAARGERHIGGSN